MIKNPKRALLGAAVSVALVVPAAGIAVADSDSQLTAPAKAGNDKDIRKATKMIKDGHYVGLRGDGESIDAYYCANGKFYSNTGGGISEGKGWKVKKATFGKNGLVAIVGKGSFSVAIAKKGKQWQFGYEFGGDAAALGDVERTDAKKDCKTL